MSGTMHFYVTCLVKINDVIYLIKNGFKIISGISTGLGSQKVDHWGYPKEERDGVVRGKIFFIFSILSRVYI